MTKYTTEELTNMRQTIEEQIWFDHIKKVYPVEVDKLINEFSMREHPKASDYIDPRKILRFKDIEILAGETAKNNLKRYFYSLHVDCPNLSDSELARLYFIISVFPFTLTDDPTITLTDILFRAIEINRENNQR